MMTGALSLIKDADRFNNWLFSRFSQHVDKRSVWEIGSGIGTISSLLLESRYLCLSDYEKPYLEHLGKIFAAQGNVVIKHVDLENLDVTQFQPLRFSTIICINVLEHIKNHEEALRNISRVMNAETKLVLLVPAHPFLYGSMDEEAGHQRRYTRAMLEKMLLDCGHVILDSQYFNRFSALAWFIKGRILKQRNIQAHDVRIINHLVPLLRLERLLPLPFGQSLITVSRLQSGSCS